MSNEPTDGVAVGGDNPTARERFERLRERESFVVAATAVAIAALPTVVIGGLRGYEGLPALMLIWAIFAVGFDLLLGYTGLLSFGHAAFWGGSAYIAGLFSANVSGSPILMLLAGTAFAAVFAWVLGFLSLRRSGIYFSILTLAFGQMTYYLALSPLSEWTNGENGFTSVSLDPLLGVIDLGQAPPVVWMLFNTWEYIFVGVVALVAVAVAYRIINSPYGMVFRAIRENEQRAQFVGLNVWRYKLMSFVLSGAFAGAAGSLFTIHSTYVPLNSLYWTESGEIVIMTVLGGTGSLFGPMVGAGLYLWVENVLSGFVGDYWHLILGLIFVLVVVLVPDGLWGLRDAVRGDGGDN